MTKSQINPSYQCKKRLKVKVININKYDGSIWWLNSFGWIWWLYDMIWWYDHYDIWWLNMMVRPNEWFWEVLTCLLTHSTAPRGGGLTSLDTSFAQCFGEHCKKQWHKCKKKVTKTLHREAENTIVLHDLLCFRNSIQNYDKRLLIQPKM